MDKLPAQLAGQIDPAQLQDDKQFARIEGIINSMTPQERAQPELIKASRKRRIAAGAGVPVQAVNQLLNQFEQMQKMMKMMKGGNLQRMMRNMKGMLPGMREFAGCRRSCASISASPRVSCSARLTVTARS